MVGAGEGVRRIEGRGGAFIIGGGMDSPNRAGGGGGAFIVGGSAARGGGASERGCGAWC